MIAGLTLLLVAVVAVVAVVLPEGDGDLVPAPIEELFPLPGDSVVRQTGIEIDMPVGYVVDLEVDGIRIPPLEVGFVAGTGQWYWEPRSGGVIEVWPDGEHTVTIRWDRTSGGRPDPGTFTWTFRVQ